jgi:hypothetical protein
MDWDKSSLLTPSATRQRQADGSSLQILFNKLMLSQVPQNGWLRSDLTRSSWETTMKFAQFASLGRRASVKFHAERY